MLPSLRPTTPLSHLPSCDVRGLISALFCESQFEVGLFYRWSNLCHNSYIRLFWVVLNTSLCVIASFSEVQRQTIPTQRRKKAQEKTSTSIWKHLATKNSTDFKFCVNMLNNHCNTLRIFSAMMFPSLIKLPIDHFTVYQQSAHNKHKYGQ